MPKNQKPNNKYYIFSVVALILAIGFGFYIGRNSGLAEETIQNTFSMFGFLQNLPPFAIFLFVLFNNAIKIFFSIILGLLFGIFPLYFLYTNGFLLGIVSAYVLAKSSPLVLIAGILPHGILELTGVVIGCTYGVWLGVGFIRLFKYKEPIGSKLRKSIQVYVKIILPILLVAALIEAYITPTLIDWAEK